jgi:hypothetical protein
MNQRDANVWASDGGEQRAASSERRAASDSGSNGARKVWEECVAEAEVGAARNVPHATRTRAVSILTTGN